MKSIKKTFIIIVNYNNSDDTIVCLQDLKQKKWKNIEVVLVDNCSTDNSVIKINEFLKEKYSKSYNHSFAINFLKLDTNKGFAAGNNIGINFAFSKCKDPFYIWMLNNDTKVDQKSLSSLISFFESDNYGIIGSKILDFDPPHTIQSIYGTFNRFTARTKTIQNINSINKISYPIGASLFLDSKIIMKVGFFNENYFLYHEEIDFSIRVLRNNLKIGVCLNSIVYHKQGASTGSFKNKKKENLHIEKYKYKGLILLYKKFYKNYILFAYINLILKSIKFSLRGEFANALLILKVIFKNN